MTDDLIRARDDQAYTDGVFEAAYREALDAGYPPEKAKELAERECSMNEYEITYAHGGRPEREKANSPLEAIRNNALRSVPKARFFETDPKTDPNYFAVTNVKTGEVTYYSMVMGS